MSQSHMHETLDLPFMPTPGRVLLNDAPVEVLEYAVTRLREGVDVAVAFLVEIRGGAARALGSPMAIDGGGGFCGYVSGGCVEAAVAAEALLAFREGYDRIVKFGDGSPFIDIALPCGGGISVAIHLLRDGSAVEGVLSLLAARQPATLHYSFTERALDVSTAVTATGWQGEHFVIRYHPQTRILVSGQTVEAEVVGRLAQVCGFEVARVEPRGSAINCCPTIDEYTAVVLLHHDLEMEASIIELALQSPAFYIGALGSSRTHRRRSNRLKASGHTRTDVERIHAPIGLFGPVHDSSSLALSILAEVAASRLALKA